MKKTTNLYYLIDCSRKLYGQQSKLAQRSVIKALRAMRCARFPSNVKTHLIGFNDKAIFLNAFRTFPCAGNPHWDTGLNMLKTVIEYQRSYEPKQTRSVFLLYSSGEVLNGWQKPLRELYACPEFANGLRYVIAPQPLSDGETEPLIRFCDFPERILPYFSESRLISLIQTIAQQSGVNSPFSL